MSSKPVNQPPQEYIGVAAVVGNDPAKGGAYREAGMKPVGGHEAQVAGYRGPLSRITAIFVASEIGTCADAEGQMIVEKCPNGPKLRGNAPTSDRAGIAFVEI